MSKRSFDSEVNSCELSPVRKRCKMHMFQNLQSSHCSEMVHHTENNCTHTKFEVISSNPDHNGWRSRTLSNTKYNKLLAYGYIRIYCVSTCIIKKSIDPKDISIVISKYLDLNEQNNN